MATTWESFAACIEARGTEVGQVVRDIAGKAFNDATDKAMAFCEALVDWWDRLDPRVKRVVGGAAAIGLAAGGTLAGLIAKVIITESSVALLAEAGAEVALGLVVIAASFALGAFVTMAHACVLA
ncbi:hypothetical protein [Actinocrispum wychmicini]|uniref:Uncharacterized protein n=1 Tax=Actinocrispum wychmicini TaxID=1213861 RepID=A0A4R2JUN5_9PSEU|nr:hypothetical protein [Actinocrispum wychmicini]TCO62917.1 hypothetical protein EV192_1021057 [Actinocrispum wychmicini]